MRFFLNWPMIGITTISALLLGSSIALAKPHQPVEITPSVIHEIVLHKLLQTVAG